MNQHQQETRLAPVRAPHSTLLAAMLLFLGLLASCTPPPANDSHPSPNRSPSADQAAAQGNNTTIPPLTDEQAGLFGNNDAGAEDVATEEVVANLDQALACLATGRDVYGVALANSNVRAEPAVEACRMGRAPRGRIVRIEDIVPTSPTLANGENADELNVAAVGYNEDILPIFQRSCETCHSGVAKLSGLQVTEYDALLAGSENGPVVVPGDADASLLWEQVRTGTMPLIGELADEEKALIAAWINSGAAETRGVQQPEQVDLWASINVEDVDLAPNNCAAQVDPPRTLISADLVQFLTCGAAPASQQAGQQAVQQTDPLASQADAQPFNSANSTGRVSPNPPPPNSAAAPVEPASIASATGSTGSGAEGSGSQESELVASEADAAGDESAPASVEDAATSSAGTVASGEGVAVSAAAVGTATGIAASSLGLPAPTNDDAFLIPRGGYCLERRLDRLQDNRGVTAITFAPNGTMFLALDSPVSGQDVDPLILLDAYHPSRSIAVYNSVEDSGFSEIFTESSRITGLDYDNGSLYISRAGEVGRIPDGGEYQKLAGGFAVQSQLFHANNGIVVSNGWVYVSAGGVLDGWSDGPFVGISEGGAMDLVSGGNRFAARIVRAPVDQLLGERSIENFQTAARGVRNPYGLTAGPDGRLWFTDNGATNVPEDVSAGDEVNVFDPGSVAGGTAEGSTPFYGFPLALAADNPAWIDPVLGLPNAAAPTGITWAYDTVFFAQYGRFPGIYRMARTNDGRLTAERIVLAWPVLTVATAPDGALWFGTGTGGVFRMTPGCS